MLDTPYIGVIGLALGFSLGAFFGRTMAISQFWRKVDARLRGLNDSHKMSVQTREGQPLTLEEFLAELKK